MNKTMERAQEIYAKQGQIGVIVWADQITDPFVYWMHCDPCDCHESPSVADDDDDIHCLVCWNKVGTVQYADDEQI